MSFELLQESAHLSFWKLSDKCTAVMNLDIIPGKFQGFLPSLLKGLLRTMTEETVTWAKHFFPFSE